MIKRPNPPRDADAYLSEKFALYRDYMKHEDALINFRLGWLIQINSFLIAAIVLLFAGAVGAAAQKSQLSNASIEAIQVAIFSLSFAIGSSGLAISLATRRSVLAAHRALESLAEDWRRLVDRTCPSTHRLRAKVEEGKKEHGNVPTGVYSLALMLRYGGRWFVLEELRSASLPKQVTFLPPIAGGGVAGAVGQGFRVSGTVPMIFIVVWTLLLLFSSWFSFRGIPSLFSG